MGSRYTEVSVEPTGSQANKKSSLNRLSCFVLGVLCCTVSLNITKHQLFHSHHFNCLMANTKIVASFCVTSSKMVSSVSFELRFIVVRSCTCDITPFKHAGVFLCTCSDACSSTTSSTTSTPQSLDAALEAMGCVTNARDVYLHGMSTLYRVAFMICTLKLNSCLFYSPARSTRPVDNEYTNPARFRLVGIYRAEVQNSDCSSTFIEVYQLTLSLLKRTSDNIAKLSAQRNKSNIHHGKESCYG